jgi:hypothetical protein
MTHFLAQLWVNTSYSTLKILETGEKRGKLRERTMGKIRKIYILNLWSFLIYAYKKIPKILFSTQKPPQFNGTILGNQTRQNESLIVNLGPMPSSRIPELGPNLIEKEEEKEKKEDEKKDKKREKKENTKRKFITPSTIKSTKVALTNIKAILNLIRMSEKDHKNPDLNPLLQK